jgi:hypothetical protein
LMSPCYALGQSGVVFLEFGGEGPTTSYPRGEFAALAQQYSALLVSLEHRCVCSVVL